MKTIPLVLVTLLAVAASVQSQDPDAADSGESTSAPVFVPTSARILGDVPDGTPPPPQPPKPVFSVPAKDILTTNTHQQGGRTITIRRIKPIALPPLIEAAQVDINDPAIQEDIAAWRDNIPSEEFLCVAATVFRFRDASARSLVSVWPDGKGEPVTFWSSADFGYLSGCSSYIGSDGITRSLLLLLSTVDVDQASALLAVHNGEYDPPDIPQDPAGKAGFVVTTEQAVATSLASIQSLHDVYNNEHDRLKTAWQGRERLRIEREAYLKANPPQPKNITLNYWRTEKPAAVQGGGQ